MTVTYKNVRGATAGGTYAPALQLTFGINMLRLTFCCKFFVTFTVTFTLYLSARCQQPHIILIVADDLGWNDVGYHESDVKTPNIDRLANGKLYVCLYPGSKHDSTVQNSNKHVYL